MTKTQRAIAALKALPDDRREEVAEIVLELAEAVSAAGSALSEEQRAELRARRAGGFRAGDPSRIDALLARLA